MLKVINEICRGENLTKYAYIISGMQIVYVLLIAGIFALIFGPSENSSFSEPTSMIYEILYLPPAVIYLILGSTIYLLSFKKKFKTRCLFYPLFFIILSLTYFCAFLPASALLQIGMFFLIPLFIIIPISFIHGLMLDFKNSNKIQSQ